MYQSNNHSTYAALYTRFSRDEPDGESNSIANQKKLLLNYAHSRGIVNTKFLLMTVSPERILTDLILRR